LWLCFCVNLNAVRPSVHEKGHMYKVMYDEIG
jgi:hypothetical protein